MKGLCSFLIGLICIAISAGTASAAEESVTAIDIALQPDATMIKYAQAANAELRKVYPKGFALDSMHHPHITVLQRFVRTADLDKVYSATRDVIDKERPGRWTLNAFKYYFIPTGTVGVAGIVIKPTPDLIRLQKELMAAVEPFTVPTVTAAAFVTTPAEPDINQPTMDYVASFGEKQSGKKYNPHVTTGIGTVGYLHKLLLKPFARFEFLPEAACVYQLGNFGTAQKRLKTFKFTKTEPNYAAPLQSWNDRDSRRSIIAFVEKVTKTGSPDFVPVDQRIATFDNDGTLWAEQPMYVQLQFALDRVKALAPQHTEWGTQEPFASLLKGDIKAALAGGEQSLAKIILDTHSGMTTEEFDKIASDWIATAKHPVTKRLYTDMVYQPMLELLSYLRANGFKTFIVSGGGIDFMRPWTQKVYGIPPEQVVGSSVKTKFEMHDGKPVLMRLPEINFNDDNVGKPVGIQEHIGRRPIAAFGNSDGDLEMLQWTTAGTGRRFALLVHHTDAEREWVYDRKSSIGHLDKALDFASKAGWTVVDMKNDWNTIFPFGNK
ncbi:MAG: haloacid dehalogenase-like hydrolase [Candidatus Obscuribacterales bacterium]